MFLGAHITYDEQSIKQLHRSGGNVVQIMTNFNNDNVFKIFKQFTKKHKIKIIIHASYIINLCRYWNPFSWWIIKIRNDIKHAHQLGSTDVVVHLGEKVGINESVCINNMITSITHILFTTQDKYKSVRLLIETGAGQGSQIGYKLEQLSKLFKHFDKLPHHLRCRIKICLDSCHLFAAGYDITTKKQVKQLWIKIDQLLGLHNIALVHLNDSKKPVGSRVDRHQTIGKGYIGKKGLCAFYLLCVKHQIPVVLETPNNSYINEIKILKQL